ncbi:MAG TPA: hypothetical protein PKI46_00150 [Bacteroidales bacterium]|nr:hypothetical protein [Bacteroidales bacterium]
MTKQDLRDLLLGAGYTEYKNNHYITSNRYTLRHGEYEQPDYSIRKEKGSNDYYIYVRYYFYNNTINAPINGRISPEELEYLKMENRQNCYAKHICGYIE